nr:hypothetical protein K-LCC10_0057 [Kaumoebavirus]
MQWAPLEIQLEIVRTLSLREFKAYRRTCKSFSEVPLREYRRYEMSQGEKLMNDRALDDNLAIMRCFAWWELARCKTVRGFFDYLDECGAELRPEMGVQSKILMVCKERKLWDVECILDVHNESSIIIDGHTIRFTHRGDKIASVSIDAYLRVCDGRWYGNKTDDLCTKIIMDIMFLND